MCCEILRLFFEKFGPLIRHHAGVRGFVTESSDSILLCELDTTAIFLYLHGLFMPSIRIDFVFVEYRTNRNDNSFKLGTNVAHCRSCQAGAMSCGVRFPGRTLTFSLMARVF